MNVRCESCETVYRIDPLKVPVEGVHARCTVCSAVIPIQRVTEEDAPATDRPKTPHAPSTEDRVAHALGDAFIPAPVEEDPGSATDVDDVDTGLDLPDRDLSDEEREAERTSERQAVQSMPGIIMPPTDDDLFETPEEHEAQASGEVRAPSAPRPSVDAESETQPIEPVRPRVSRPFIPPDDLPFANPNLERPEQQVRPTAPVFRPTPGRPAQTPITAPPSKASAPAAPPPAPSKPFRPLTSPSVTASPQTPFAPPPASPPSPRAAAPLAPPAAATPAPPPAAPPSPPPAAAAPSPAAPPSRPINPFLSRDPGQKARRLARALISDMIVYQPEKRQKALEDGTLAEAFDEEIKKSWEEYVDQVGEDLANSTTYFNDALNELLADGEKMF